MPAGGDRKLLALLAETRAAEEAFAAAVIADDDDAQDATSERLEAALAEMARTPSEGVQGVLVKAARLCRSLDGHTIMYADEPVAASLRADLARLAPGVRA